MIDVFPWNKNFETGIALIDEQHQQLVRLLNNLANHLGRNSDHALLDETFAELAEYAQYHFRSEEEVWSEYFPMDSSLKGHLKIHTGFLSKVLELKAEEESKPLHEVVEDVLSFLTHWLAHHILDSDMRMSKVVLAMQSGMSLETAQQQAEKEMSGVMTVMIDTTLTMYDHLCERTIELNREISSRREMEEKLLLSSRVFNDTLEGILITDVNKVIVDVNPAFCDITGYSHKEVIGKNPNILSSGKQFPEFYSDMWQSLNVQGHWQGEVWNRKKCGEIYAELLTISSLKNEDDIVTNYVGIFTDITTSKQHQDELNLMAHYDVLTGLPNRILFADRFHQAIAHSKRMGSHLAVCFLDLDNFKPVNDNFGHETGDELLIEVAKRIQSCLREEDTISRQGGDEFTLLLNDIESYEQVEQTLERIEHSFSQPYIISGYPHKITVSSGVTLYPDDDGDVDTLLRHADNAMYQAKQSGRNCHQLFNTTQDKEVSLKHDRLGEISLALENNEFELYYQPKVNMQEGNVFGAEALIRWNHPEQGLIPPLDFLPIIEATDLEIKVGRWVIEQALKQLERWHNQGISLEVSVNIASYHILSEQFFSELESALARYPDVDSNNLQLEILESSALGDLNAIREIIKACQDALGVKVALDDFGTGYSSLTHLRNLPANTIKVDQSFVRDMLDDPSDYTIIDGIVGLAESFSREVIAEGVETTEHGLMLMLMGCYEAQGYGIAKPMTTSDLSNWLAAYIPNQEWISNARQQRTQKENKIKLFRLVCTHWQQRFSSSIHAHAETTQAWPIMGDKHCHCGAWIKRAKQENLFITGLSQLEEAHKEMHFLAQAIHQKYLDGGVNDARDVMGQLQTSFDAISNALGQCE